MKLYVFVFCILSSILFAQLGTRIPSTKIGGENSNWTFGGFAGVTGAFGSNSGVGISLTPRLGYKVSESFEVGASGSLNFHGSSFVSTNSIGIGPFANYYFGRSVFISSQFQQFFVNQKIKNTGQKFSTSEAALFIGGGYLQKLGENAYMQIGGMYNVLWNKNKSIFAEGFQPNIGIVYGL